MCISANTHADQKQTGLRWKRVFRSCPRLAVGPVYEIFICITELKATAGTQSTAVPPTHTLHPMALSPHSLSHAFLFYINTIKINAKQLGPFLVFVVM